jgi:hypothetical protein
MIAPITIEIIMHYYCTGGEDFPDSQAFQNNAKMLVEAGMLIPASEIETHRKYEANQEACKKYIDHLCNIPFPNLEWIMPNRTYINEGYCNIFQIDYTQSSATKCKCGKEKWQHII